MKLFVTEIRITYELAQEIKAHAKILEIQDGIYGNSSPYAPTTGYLLSSNTILSACAHSK